MKFSKKWEKALESRDRDALGALINDKFAFIRHQSDKEISKEEILNFWTSDGPQPESRNQRIIYENDNILVTHQFLDFPSGDKEAVMVVLLLEDGKAIRMETGATPMPS